jgi:mRNA interferase YafQ
LNIYYTTQFKRDYKRLKKQRKNLDQLKVVIDKLAAGEKLEPKYRDHGLSGNWKGHRDCHIEPDWILIYIMPRAKTQRRQGYSSPKPHLPTHLCSSRLIFHPFIPFFFLIFFLFPKKNSGIANYPDNPQ